MAKIIAQIATTLVGLAFASTFTPQVEIYASALKGWQSPSPDVETSHWAELSQQASRLSAYKYGVFAKSKLYKGFDGFAVSIPVNIGNQTFYLIVDTGSSDTWIPSADFKCLGNGYTPIAHPTQATCAFGPLYKAASGFEQIHDANFNITYADFSYLNGIPGHDTITIAGITIPEAQINLVEKAVWDGDNFTSGILGLAYPAITNVYAGNDPSKDKIGQTVPYAPIFKSMYTNASVAPLFSLALQRKPNSPGLTAGGKIAFGGLPPVNYSGNFTRTQIIIHDILIYYPAGETHYSEYTIIPDGFVFPGAGKLNNATANDTEPGNKENKKNMVPTEVPMFIDSGSELMYLPRKIAEAVNAAFSPPAVYDRGGFFYTECNAVPPRFGMIVGGTTFYLNPEDMFSGRLGNGYCLTAIMFGGRPLGLNVPPIYVIGVPFLKNVLAVFDVGAGEMRFASMVES